MNDTQPTMCAQDWLRLAVVNSGLRCAFQWLKWFKSRRRATLLKAFGRGWLIPRYVPRYVLRYVPMPHIPLGKESSNNHEINEPCVSFSVVLDAFLLLASAGVTAH
jgi:hypothetical protein